MSHKITVKSGTSVRLPTAGKYCEKDIVVISTGQENPYNGEYIITPKVEAQTMKTKNKTMLDDVTIKAIPYAEVTNLSNGKTVTIA